MPGDDFLILEEDIVCEAEGVFTFCKGGPNPMCFGPAGKTGQQDIGVQYNPHIIEGWKNSLRW